MWSDFKNTNLNNQEMHQYTQSKKIIRDWNIVLLLMTVLDVLILSISIYSLNYIFLICVVVINIIMLFYVLKKIASIKRYLENNEKKSESVNKKIKIQYIPTVLFTICIIMFISRSVLLSLGFYN